MKKLLTFSLVLAAIVGGFALGRLTGSPNASLPILSAVNRDFPLFPAPPKSDDIPIQEPLPEKDIVVETPLDGERPRQTSFEVTGRAKAGDITVRVGDDAGAELFSQTVTIAAATGEYGRFAVGVRLAQMPTAPVTLTVGRSDVPAAAHETRRLAFGGADDIAVNVYFSSGNAADGSDCGVVYPVARTVPFSVAVYRAAIEELLKGPNDGEQTLGSSTAIPTGVVLKSVGANADGVVTADFDTKLTRGISDACRLETIRAQIGATLKQFPEARDVIITVGGEADVFGTSQDN